MSVKLDTNSTPRSEMIPSFDKFITEAMKSIKFSNLRFLFYFFIVVIIIIIILSGFHLDIDECITKNHSCEGNTTCNNTIGSYICRRKEGYQEIETNCTGKYSYLTTGNVNISVKTTTLT